MGSWILEKTQDLDVNFGSGLMTFIWVLGADPLFTVGSGNGQDGRVTAPKTMYVGPMSRVTLHLPDIE